MKFTLQWFINRVQQMAPIGGRRGGLKNWWSSLYRSVRHFYALYGVSWREEEKSSFFKKMDHGSSTSKPQMAQSTLDYFFLSKLEFFFLFFSINFDWGSQFVEKECWNARRGHVSLFLTGKSRRVFVNKWQKMAVNNLEDTISGSEFQMKVKFMAI